MIKVIVDSGMDQNKWFKNNYDYDFLPLSVILDNEAYIDEQEITLEELHKEMKSGKMPSTSQPSPGQVQEVLEKNRKEGNDVIFVTIWKNLSGTYQVIKSIVDEYKEQYPDFKVAIVDCLSASVAGTLVAIQAMEMIEAGYDFEDVVEQAEWNAENVLINLTVDNLNWLVQGGRVSKTAGFIGSALNVKPILRVNEEELYSDTLVRGNKRVYSRLVKNMKEESKAYDDQLVLISHVGEEENARKVEEIVKKEMPNVQTMIFEFGAVLAAHIGVGGVAIATIKEKPESYFIP